MSKSKFADQVDQIQSQLAPLLKEAGFKRRGRTFNRNSLEGLVSVVNFQMGKFDPPGTTSIPGLRENLYGSFTINLGIYVPEVYRTLFDSEVKGFVLEYHCCIRSRLGMLGREKRDIWWQVDISSNLSDDLKDRLVSDAFPFLHHFETRGAILQDWPDYYNIHQFGSSSPPYIVLAVISATQGKTEDARRLLEKQIEQSHKSGHKEYVRGLAKKLGLEPLKT
jgi:hypothetical protein